MTLEKTMFRFRDLLQFPTLVDHMRARAEQGFFVIVCSETEALEHVIVRRLEADLADEFTLDRVSMCGSGYNPLYRTWDEDRPDHRIHLLRGFPYERFQANPEGMEEEMGLLFSHMESEYETVTGKKQCWVLFCPKAIESQLSYAAPNFYRTVCYTAGFIDFSRYERLFEMQPQKAEGAMKRAQNAVADAKERRRRGDALYRLSRIAAKYDHLEAAKKQLASAAEVTFDPAERLRITLQQARVARWQGERARAQVFLEEASQVLAAVKSGAEKAALALEWGWFALGGGSPDQANFCLTEVIEAGATLHDTGLDRAIHRLRAAIYERQGYWREARNELLGTQQVDEESLMMQARSLFKLGETSAALDALGALFGSHGNRLSQVVRGRCLGLVGQVLSRLGHVTSAYEHALNGRNLLEDSGYREYLPEAYLGLGSLVRDERAAEYFQKAFQHAGEVEDHYIQTKSLVRLAECAVDRNDMDEAKDLAEQAMSLAQVGGFREAEGMARSIQCHVLTQSGQWALALGQGSMALDIFDKSGVASPMARLLLRLAKVHAFLRNKQQSIKFLSMSLETYRKMEHLPGEARTLEALATFYKEQGRASQADSYATRAARAGALVG
ncbi:tetratricopeptide repeat protein [Acanthopleuribacter pedis]|uniref:MalT-like TPR region domain-containing protein n=1 Tax=Acanthopleuribacter pedis TaxID=442870 RepID=A0A8J7QFJ5_9BACT|nr:hypothetical protein [Acanthopleuribacter pedis]MBO1318980.1 hypothetical protein [Acanthopleuribacter pedis]